VAAAEAMVALAARWRERWGRWELEEEEQLSKTRPMGFWRRVASLALRRVLAVVVTARENM